MKIFKLAEKIIKKYGSDINNAEHYGVDPETGVGIVPKFENGDIVEINGKKAIYITHAYWEQSNNLALVQYMDVPALRHSGSGKFKRTDFNYNYADEKSMVLVKKKQDR